MPVNDWIPNLQKMNGNPASIQASWDTLHWDRTIAIISKLDEFHIKRVDFIFTKIEVRINV
ncbi:hypothetical protein PCCS19_37630 [Paenibacillus sp. CCS19]|nr:hypothetical protein PCCS19_37630 [Paenibacillus cellulosilyticus]